MLLFPHFFCNMQSNPHLINHLGLPRQTYFLINTIQLFCNDLGPHSHQIHSKSHGKIYPIKCFLKFCRKPVFVQAFIGCFFLEKQCMFWKKHMTPPWKNLQYFCWKIKLFFKNAVFSNDFKENTCKIDVSLHQIYAFGV